MIYSGTWLEGKKAYQGLHYYQHPHTYYQGEWANDLKHGQGKLIFSNGEFEGKWEADRRQGPGQLRKTEIGITQVYEGQWEQDQLPFGKVTYYDQKSSEVGRYNGQLMEGKKHGVGVYSWRGAKYEGEFQNDCIQGKGLFKIGKTSFSG